MHSFLFMLILTLVLPSVTAAEICSEGGYCPQRELIFTREDIGTLDQASSTRAADLDDDGDLDVVASDSIGQKVVWYERTSDGSWAAHDVATDLPQCTEADVGDMDGDGDLDIVSGSYAFARGDIFWYANDGSGAGWSSTKIEDDLPGFNRVRTADIDGDGHLDVAAVSSTQNIVAWWGNNGDGTDWTRHEVATGCGRAVLGDVADMDRDGDLDLVATCYKNDTLVWYENANGAGTLWIERVVNPAFPCTISDAEDVDGDGDLDVVSADDAAGDVAWFEQGMPFGGALEMDGTNEYVTAGSLNLGNSDLTVEVWLRPTVDGRTNQYVFSHWANRAQFTYNLEATDHTITYYTPDTSGVPVPGTRISSTTKLNDGMWHHVAWVDSGETKKIYIDGVLEATGPANGAVYDIPILLGGSVGSQAYEGQMDEVRIWDTDLAQAEIRGWMHRPVDGTHPNATHLVAYYPFDEGSGDKAFDSAGDNDGTLNSMEAEDWIASTAPGWTTHTIDDGFTDAMNVHAADLDGDGDTDVLAGSLGSEVAWWEQGTFGGALEFDGVDEYVEIPDHPSLHIADTITIEAWVMWDGTLGYKPFVSRPAGDQVTGKAMGLTDGMPFFACGNTRNIFADQAIAANTWTHLAISYDGQAYRLYVNGALTKSVDFESPATMGETTKVLLIGREFIPGVFNDRVFPGAMDEVRIWSTALSQDDIKAWMHQEVDDGHPSYDNLVAYYRFDEGSGSTATDAKGDNDGTLMNMEAEDRIDPWWTRHPLDSSFSHASTILDTDLDDDGVADVLAGSRSGGEVSWWEAELTVSGEGLPEGMLPAVNLTSAPCPEGMARISAFWGSYCIDRYEAHDAGGRRVLALAGGNDAVVSSSVTGWPTTEITVEAWVKTTITTGGLVLTYAITGSDNQFFVSNREAGLVIGVKCTGYCASDETAKSGITYYDGQWHHIAATWRSSDGRAQVYMDGVLVNTTTGTSQGHSMPDGGCLVLGQDQDSLCGGFQSAQALTGELDEVRIWNKVLDGATIRGWMSRPVDATHPDHDNLVTYYTFDEGEGTAVGDSAGNNDAVLQDMDTATVWKDLTTGERKAGSAPGKRPWLNIDVNGAKGACLAAGKRLCTDAEWMAACNLAGEKYYLTEEENDETHGCYTLCEGCDYTMSNAHSTGSHTQCRSDAGVYDLVGNVWEMTNDIAPAKPEGSGHAFVGDLLGEPNDKYGNDAALMDFYDVGANLIRGYAYTKYSSYSKEIGCFALSSHDDAGVTLGFRCCAGEATGPNVPDDFLDVLVDRNWDFVTTFNEGLDLVRSGNDEGAIAKFQECLAIDPANANALTNIAILQGVCGNSKLEGEEECDDQNTADGDGCAADCTIERPACGQGYTADLVSYWPFDNRADPGDDVAGGNDGTVSRARWTAEGQAGAALGFGGEDEYVLVPDDPSLHFKEAVTVGLWMKWDGTTGYRPPFSQPAGETPEVQVSGTGMGFSDGKPGYGFSHMGRTISADQPVPVDTWTHVAVTYDGRVSNLYINGALARTEDYGSTAPIGDTSGTLVIGREFILGYPERAFPGLLDDVAVFDRALSAGEVRALHRFGKARDGICQPPAPVCGDGKVGVGEECDDGDTADGDGCASDCALEVPMCGQGHAQGLSSYWSFDDQSAPGADRAGEHDGTPSGASWTADGRVGGAVSLDGSDDVVSIPALAMDDMAVGTIGMWVYLDANDEGTILLKQHDGNNSMGFLTIGYYMGDKAKMISTNPGKVHFHASNSATKVSSEQLLDTGRWHHVAATFSSTGELPGARLYIDGELDGTTLGSVSIPSDPQPTFTTIGHGAGRFLDGLVDEFTIFQRELTAEEVRLMYWSGLAGKTVCTELVCTGDLMKCAGVCVDTQTDPDNCGACGKACDEGKVCAEGACTADCPEGTTECTGACVDLTSNVENCGACDHACPVINANAACAFGTCTIKSCKTGYGDCDTNVTTGCETPLITEDNCGACDNSCDSGLMCTNGTCASSCPEGTTACPGGCVDLLNDTKNCGECGVRCTASRAEVGCTTGNCTILNCTDGYGDCDGNYTTGCEAFLTTKDDCGACGNTCAGGMACFNRECVCPLGRTACNGTCVDFQSNPEHCGACGTVCEEGEVCGKGVCSSECPEGTTECEGACVNIATDIDNCGTCGTVCSVFHGIAACTGGSCAVGSCESGFGDCDTDPANGCEIDIQTTDANCGACRNTCGSEEACKAGECVSTKKLDDGEPCGSSAECSSGLCATGRCCPRDECAAFGWGICRDGERFSSVGKDQYCCIADDCDEGEACDGNLCMTNETIPGGTPGPSDGPTTTTGPTSTPDTTAVPATVRALEVEVDRVEQQARELFKNEQMDKESYDRIMAGIAEVRAMGEEGKAVQGLSKLGDVEQKINATQTVSVAKGLFQLKEWTEVLQALVLIVLTLGAGAHFFKARIFGEENVAVMRGVEREGALIKVGIKVKNDSTFVITDVNVTLDAPQALAFHSPQNKFYQLGEIAPGDFQSAIYKLYPIRCVSGKISGMVSYKDAKGKVKSAIINPAEVSSICPMLEPHHLSVNEFQQLSGTYTKNAQTVGYTATAPVVFNTIKQRVAAMHPVTEAFNAAGYGEGWYAAKGKYSKKAILLMAKIEVGKAELSVFAEDPQMGTGLLAELADEIEKAAVAPQDVSQQPPQGGYGQPGQWGGAGYQQTGWGKRPGYGQ